MGKSKGSPEISAKTKTTSIEGVKYRVPKIRSQAIWMDIVLLWFWRRQYKTTIKVIPVRFHRLDKITAFLHRFVLSHRTVTMKCMPTTVTEVLETSHPWTQSISRHTSTLLTNHAFIIEWFHLHLQLLFSREETQIVYSLSNSTSIDDHMTSVDSCSISISVDKNSSGSSLWIFSSTVDLSNNIRPHSYTNLDVNHDDVSYVFIQSYCQLFWTTTNTVILYQIKNLQWQF